MKKNSIGRPVDRIDGILKVMGKAAYTAEFPVTNLAYGFPGKAQLQLAKSF